MDGVTLGKGSFAAVELATHGLVNVKVSLLYRISFFQQLYYHHPSTDSVLPRPNECFSQYLFCRLQSSSAAL